MLLESTKEQVKEPPEPTQQQLVVRASQESGFPETAGLGQFFRTRPRCDAIKRPDCQEFTELRSVEGAMMLNILK